MSCANCGNHFHAAGGCPHLAKRSAVFGAPAISAAATPSKKPGLQYELGFERQVCGADRDAYKTCVQGGVQPPSFRGSADFLRQIGG